MFRRLFTHEDTLWCLSRGIKIWISLVFNTGHTHLYLCPEGADLGKNLLTLVPWWSRATTKSTRSPTTPEGQSHRPCQQKKVVRKWKFLNMPGELLDWVWSNWKTVDPSCTITLEWWLLFKWHTVGHTSQATQWHSWNEYYTKETPI